MCLYILSFVMSVTISAQNNVRSSLPPVACMMAYVLFTLFVFDYILWYPTHIVLCFLSSSYVVSFSGLSFFFLLDLWNSLTFIQTLIHCMYALILFFFNVLKPHSNWMLSTYMSQNNAIHTQLSIYSHFIFKYLCTSYLPGVLFSGELNFPTV